MGGALSSENPNNSLNEVVKMSPNSPTPDSKSNQNQNPDPETPESQNPETSDQPINPDETGQTNPEIAKEEEDDEEEGECGFCLFMKGGGCKDQFVAWEQCVEDSEKNEEDIVEKCFEVTANLKKCMEAHSDYYEPILRAEKAAEEDIKQELDREAESKKGSEQLSVEENAEISVQN